MRWACVVKLILALFEHNACFRAPQKRNTKRKRGKFVTTFCVAKRSIKRDYDAMSVARNNVGNKVRY